MKKLLVLCLGLSLLTGCGKMDETINDYQRDTSVDAKLEVVVNDRNLSSNVTKIYSTSAMKDLIVNGMDETAVRYEITESAQPNVFGIDMN